LKKQLLGGAAEGSEPRSGCVRGHALRWVANGSSVKSACSQLQLQGVGLLRVISFHQCYKRFSF